MSQLLYLTKQGDLQFNYCLIYAPAGSGCTTLLQYIAQQFNLQPYILDACEVDNVDNFRSKVMAYQTGGRLIKKQEKTLLFIENIEHLPDAVIRELINAKNKRYGIEIQAQNAAQDNKRKTGGNKAQRRTPIILNKPIILATASLYEGSLYNLRQISAVFSLKLDFNKVSQTFRNSISENDLALMKQNISLIKKQTLSKGIPPPCTPINLITGLLLKQPEIILGVHDVNRIEAPQFLEGFNYTEEYGSPGQIYHILDTQTSLDYNQIHQRLAADILKLPSLESTGVSKNVQGHVIKRRSLLDDQYSNISRENDYQLYGFEDINHLFESGYQSTSVYTQYLRDLSDSYAEGLSNNIVLYRLSTLITEPATAQGRDKLIKNVNKYSYNNTYYQIRQINDNNVQFQSKTEFLGKDFFTDYLPICRQIAYFGCNTILSIETIQKDEVEHIASSIVILSQFVNQEINAPVTNFFQQSALNYQFDRGQDKDNANKVHNIIDKHLYEYISEGVSHHVDKIITSQFAYLSIDDPNDLAGLKEQLRKNEQVELHGDEVSYTYNNGVTLAVRTNTLFQDFF